jgi:hypothetical protein
MDFLVEKETLTNSNLGSVGKQKEIGSPDKLLKIFRQLVFNLHLIG